MNNQIILTLMGLLMASLMLVGLPKAFADVNACNGGANGGCNEKPAILTPDTPKHDEKKTHLSKQCSLDGFCGADEKKTTTTPAGHSGGGSKHHSGSSLSNTGSSTHSGLIQLPSNRSDFSNGDTSSIHLVFVHGKIDAGGFWHVDGRVQNTGNNTIQQLTVIATIYNAAHQPISDMQQPAIIGSNTVLEPGQQKPFQLYNSIVGQMPVFFKLGYDW